MIGRPILYKTTKDFLLKFGLKDITELPSIEEFERLESVPPEMEWYANLRNPNTRRAYQNDVREFMAFLGIDGMEELRRVGRAHVR